MFGFLKDKIKSALGKFTKEVEKDAKVETKETIVETPKDKDTKKDVKKESKDNSQITKRPIQKSKTSESPISKSKVSDKKIVEKTIEKKKEIVKSNQKTQAKPLPSKQEPVKVTKPISKPIKDESVKKEDKIESKLESKETISSTNTQKEELKKEPEKKGFFQRLFSRSEDKKPELKEEVIEKTSEKIQEPEEVIESKEELREKLESEEVAVELSDETLTDQATEEVEEESEEETSGESEEEQLEEETEEKEAEEKISAEKIIVQEKQKSRNQLLEEERSKKIVEEKTEEKKGFFTKITETFTKIQITEEKFEELFWDLEVAMLENNVAVEVIDKIKRDLKKELMAGRVSRGSVDELIASTLKKSIIELFDVEKINLIEKIKSKKDGPYIISIIGVNGSGKTTSIAKLTHKLQKEGLSVVLSASDTFRAAAIQQLEEHANRLNVKMIKHDYNSDPAAVAFDAINYAKAKNIDVVIIDTAGRLHSNTNLMRELEKIIRVCKPDIKIFVGESITGNDCVEQAKEFDNAVGIDAIILAKADIDDKGGAAISVSYILQRPILYLGTGQTYDDLKEFDSNIIVNSLGL